MRLALALIVALLAGCLDGTGARREASDVDAAVHGPERSVERPGDPGIFLSARAASGAFAPGESIRVDATLENRGRTTRHYPSGCGEPWGFEVKDSAGRAVQHEEPRGRCLGFATASLAPAEAVAAAFAWDGREWNGEKLVAATPGSYDLVVSARLSDGPAPYEAFSVSVTVEVS